MPENEKFPIFKGPIKVPVNERAAITEPLKALLGDATALTQRETAA